MSDFRDEFRESVGAPFSLTQKSGPWVVFAPDGDRLLEIQLTELGRLGGVVRHLDAGEMRDPASLFREFARTLSFPGYFGHNWDALVDCLDDLHGDWHGGTDVTIVIDRADLLISAEHLPLFVSVLCQAAERANSAVDLDGELLDRPAIALHFAFSVRRGDLGELAEMLKRGDRTIVRRHPYVTIE
jgi:barstar (barnase inhibitor)